MWTLLFAITALARPPTYEQELTWDLSVGGTSVGVREVRIKYFRDGDAFRRVVTATTDLTLKIDDTEHRYRDRITGHAGAGPAAFHAVREMDGVTREVQGRRDGSIWRVATVYAGRAKKSELPFEDVHVSTVDLIDPGSQVPIRKAEDLKMLSAETGAVLEGNVADMGSVYTTVGDETVQTQRYVFAVPAGLATFEYARQGYLVRYDFVIKDTIVTASLRSLPQDQADGEPIKSDYREGITSQEL